MGSNWCVFHIRYCNYRLYQQYKSSGSRTRCRAWNSFHKMFMSLCMCVYVKSATRFQSLEFLSFVCICVFMYAHAWKEQDTLLFRLDTFHGLQQCIYVCMYIHMYVYFYKTIRTTYEFVSNACMCVYTCMNLQAMYVCVYTRVYTFIQTVRTKNEIVGNACMCVYTCMNL